MIERHHDVAPDGFLRLDAEFRAEQDGPSIQIALESRSLLAHLPRVRQRENLKASRVRQHRAIPAHEVMDAADAAEDFRSRSQQQVIGIGQQDLRASLFERLRELPFDRRLGADRHEERREDVAVRGPKGSGPGAGVGGVRLDVEIQASVIHGRVHQRRSVRSSSIGQRGGGQAGNGIISSSEL